MLEYFTFQNIFTDQTLLQGIYLLQPGHFGILDLGEREIKLDPNMYWDYHFREPENPVKEEYVEELDRLFKQAVNRQLIGDVELGSYLSGGMDSKFDNGCSSIQFSIS